MDKKEKATAVETLKQEEELALDNVILAAVNETAKKDFKKESKKTS